MAIEDIRAAAERAGLDNLLAQSPDEVAVAIELAREQAAALRALPLEWDDAP